MMLINKIALCHVFVIVYIKENGEFSRATENQNGIFEYYWMFM